MTRMGWFTPPFDTANDVRQRLEPYYEIIDFQVEGAMIYFRAKKTWNRSLYPVRLLSYPQGQAS